MANASVWQVRPVNSVDDRQTIMVQVHRAGDSSRNAKVALKAVKNAMPTTTWAEPEWVQNCFSAISKASGVSVSALDMNGKQAPMPIAKW